MFKLSCPNYADDYLTPKNETALGLPACPDNFTLCNCSNSLHAFRCVLCRCPKQHTEAPAFWHLALIYTIVFVAGIAGNSLVILVVGRFKRMQNVTNVFLASLSITDLLLILFCVPIQFLKFMSNTWQLGVFMCFALAYTQNFTKQCSVLTLTVISIERYIAIVHPMHAIRFNSIGLAKLTVLCIWVLALLLAVPTVISVHAASVVGHHYWCIRNGNPIGAVGIYQVATVLVIPLVILIFCYGNITRVLYYASTQQTIVPQKKISKKELRDIRRPSLAQAMSPPPQRLLLRKSSAMGENQTKKQIVRMLVTIVVLFLLCWSPFLMDSLLTNLNIFCPLSLTEELKYMRMAFAVLSYINSCANPIIYAFMSTNFRQSFKLVLQNRFHSLPTDLQSVRATRSMRSCSLSAAHSARVPSTAMMKRASAVVTFREEEPGSVATPKISDAVDMIQEETLQGILKYEKDSVV